MKKNYFLRSFFIIAVFFMGFNAAAQDFITVKNGQFELEGKPYRFLGTNFWYGMNLGAFEKERLLRELDKLDELGVRNLRIMAATEGAPGTPLSMQPSVQPSPGKYNEDLLEGLDFLLSEMKKRKMYAVVCMNNFWPWSGGFPQYVSWANNNEVIPFPPPVGNGTWQAYREYAARFYSERKAVRWFRDYLKFIIRRKNTVTGIKYKDDPTIMAWQLANEPEGINNVDAYRKWLHSTARFIKKRDRKHLVSIGSEGNTPSVKVGNNFRLDHDSPYIDYCTFHLWVQNWNWYDPEKWEETYPKAIDKASRYISDHLKVAEDLNKPVVLEEFGIARDGNSYEHDSPVSVRNKYYHYIFDLMYNSTKNFPQVSGVNFWAWGGEGRPRVPMAMWKEGDDFTGDPPHEYQGWYSVYDTDDDTNAIIKEYASKFEE